MREFPPGTQIGQYIIVRTLGAGGMGTVYEVEHSALGVHYALKTYTLADEHADFFRRRFMTEGKILARLKHPNLVHVFDLEYDEASGFAYYVMDLVLYRDGEARTLADLDMDGADEDCLAGWFVELCGALAYVHSCGIVHRDIKPNNILLTPEGRVVLSDFGISRVYSDKMRTDLGATKTVVAGNENRERHVAGTEGYMAPEVQRGEDATPAADVYSLGVVFFKLLTGIWFEPSLAKGRNAAANCLDNFSLDWRGVLMPMLEENPAARPTDLAALSARLTPKPVPAEHSGWKKFAIAAVIVAIVAAVAIALAIAFSGDAKHDDDGDLNDAFAIPETVVLGAGCLMPGAVAPR